MSARTDAGLDHARAARLPNNACDSHIHIFDRRYPMTPGDTREVPDARVSDYRALQNRLGTSRVVVVQPSTYGTDNRCTLDAIREFGASARGIAVVDTSVSDEALQRMATEGIRGIRFNLVRSGATTVDMIEPLAQRIAALGWHVQLHMTPEQIVECEALLNRVETTTVFDHMARIPPEAAERHPAFRIVTGLADQGRAWVKLSGPYLFSTGGWPRFDEIVPLAHAFARAMPDRLVWGTDWPHPGASQRVDESWFAQWLSRWIPDDRFRDAVLVENPARLYGFPSEA